LFGHLSDNVERIRYDNQYQNTSLEERSPELAAVFKAIEANTFNDGGVYEPLLKTVYNTDYYLVSNLCSPVHGVDCILKVSNDFASYLEAESLADDMFANDQDEWIRKTIITCGSMATFSSDRAVQSYADEVRPTWRCHSGGY
jgi:starch phosphorylase